MFNLFYMNSVYSDYCDITHMNCSVWDCFSCDAYKKYIDEHLDELPKECENFEEKVDSEN